MKGRKELFIIVGAICLGIGTIIGVGIGKQNRQAAITNRTNNQNIKDFSPHQREEVPVTLIETEEKEENKVLEVKDPNEAFKYTKETLAKEVEKDKKERLENNKKWEKIYLEEIETIKEQYKEATGYVYLIENSDIEKITKYQIDDFDEALLAVARNEIYARHGYIFSNPLYTGYFKNKGWYIPTKKIEEIQLSEIEKYNVRYLEWQEKYLEITEKLDHQEIQLGFCDMYLFDADKLFKIDLNNDGVQEEVIFEAKEKEGNLIISGVIKVNGDIKQEVSGRLQARIWVIDIDETDDYKEMIINDVGPSGDPVDSYYYFDGKEIRAMGAIESEINSPTSYCRTYVKEGKLYATLNSCDSISQSCERTYELTSSHTLKEIPKDYWEVYHWVFTTEPVIIYEDNDLSSSKQSYEAGISLLIVGTDLKEWMKVQFENGKLGWFNTKEVDIRKLDGVGFAG